MGRSGEPGSTLAFLIVLDCTFKAFPYQNWSKGLHDSETERVRKW